METENPFRRVPLEQLAPDPRQSRKTPSDGIMGLADTVEEHGLLCPLLVRPCPEGDRYSVVAGSRRLEALKLLHARNPEHPDYREAWVLVQAGSDSEAALKSLIENLQREGLNVLDLCDAMCALRTLKEEEAGEPCSLERLAQLVGWSRSHLCHVLRYRDKIHPDLHDEARSGHLNTTWATFLTAMVPPHEQPYWFYRARQENWSRIMANQKFSLRKRLIEQGVTVPPLPPLGEPWIDLVDHTPGELCRLLANCRSVLEYLTSDGQRDYHQHLEDWQGVRSEISELYRMSAGLPD